MKKILVIGTADKLGGAARVGWNIAMGARKRGYGVKFIVGFKSSQDKDVYQLRSNSFLRWLNKITGKNILGLSKHFKAYLLANDIDFGASDEILNHPYYKEADLVHCHNLHGHFFKLETLAKIAIEKPTVWTLHDGWALTAHCTHCFDCKNYNNGRHFTPGLKRYQAMFWNNSEYLWNKKKEIYKKARNLTIVTPSKWLADRVKTSILKDKPLEVINNGIDTDIFKPREKSKVRKELGLPLDKTIIAYVAQWGTLDPRKGGQYFLDTTKEFHQDDNILFLCIGGIVGNKPERKGNIVYVPFLKDKELLSKYYSSADILLFVSLAENFPLVTLEAMATGLPIVAFDTGGVKEQITHQVNGYICKYRDSEDLVCGIRYLLSLSNKQTESISERNRAKAVKKYSLFAMTSAYIQLYEKLFKIY